MAAEPIPASTRRVSRGRGHTYLLDGERADGVTWAVSNGVPKPALINWAAEQSAKYAVNHWDELAELPIADRLKPIQSARFDTVKELAVRGTDVHQLALRLAAGETVDVPEPLEGHVDAYLKFVTDWQPVEILTETVVGNRQHRYMGTLDTVAGIQGQTWLLDWKTGASGIWPESALQLAAYRHAEFFIDGFGEEQPMLPTDRAGCVWLRADGYDLIPVDTSPAVFRTFLYAQQIARFTAEPRDHFIGDALTPPANGK